MTDRPGPTVTAGIRELQIPGVHATEALRPPVIAERALAGQTDGALMYVFQRTTGDDPFRRDPWHGPSSAGRVRDRGDAESGLERVFSPPAARRWTIDGWVTAGESGRGARRARRGEGPLRVLGALRGAAGLARVERVRRHAGAVDRLLAGRPPRVDRVGRPGHGWRSDARPGARRAAPDPRAADRGRRAVGARGRRRGRRRALPADARQPLPAGDPARRRARGAAVGIAEIHGGPSRPPCRARARSTPAATTRSPSARSGSRCAWTRTIEDLDAGRPLRAASCAPFDLPAGETRLSAKPATFVPVHAAAALGRGAAGQSRPAASSTPARKARNGTRRGIQLALTAPARLVLAESYNRGRRARCDGHDLGVPSVGDGYGTAWPVPASCRNVTITFAPNRAGGHRLRGLDPRRPVADRAAGPRRSGRRRAASRRAPRWRRCGCRRAGRR